MQVILITDSTGFPKGTATAKRILMIGRALAEVGVDFSVLTNYFSHGESNDISVGKHKGIRFRYLHGNIKQGLTKFLKLFFYVKGLIRLLIIISRVNKRDTLVYIYSQGTLFNLYGSLLCKFFGIKIFNYLLI